MLQEIKTNYSDRPCPSCGADNSHARPEVKSPLPASSRTFEDLAERWHGIFKEKSFFSYFRCDGCGVLYAPEYFSDEQLGQLYGAMPHNMSDVPLDALAKTQRGYFDALSRYTSLQGALIEIGPDNGLFVENCVREGSFSEYWMFEPNIAVHAALHERLSGKKHVISTSMFDLSGIPNGSASTAVMIHVLDHLVAPVPFLLQLREKLDEDARVFIVTHDERSLLARILNHRWPAYCLQHPHLFNHHSIRELLASGGFDTVETLRSTNYFPVTYLATHVLFAAGIRGVRFPRLPRVQIGLRLGNMITIAKPRRK